MPYNYRNDYFLYKNDPSEFYLKMSRRQLEQKIGELFDGDHWEKQFENKVYFTRSDFINDVREKFFKVYRGYKTMKKINVVDDDDFVWRKERRKYLEEWIGPSFDGDEWESQFSLESAQERAALFERMHQKYKDIINKSA